MYENAISPDRLKQLQQQRGQQGQTAQDADTFFSSFAEGLEGGTRNKAEEYRQRIEAVLQDEEMKQGDRKHLQQMQQDYLKMGGQPFWEKNLLTRDVNPAAPSKLEQDVTQMQQQVKDDIAYRGLVMRIEKARRIREDVKPLTGRPYSRQRVTEIRNIEMRSEPGDKAKETGFEEVFLNAQGYKETRFNRTWISPDGNEFVAENLVMFVKQNQNGQIEYLTDAKTNKPLALNADLYTARLTSHKYPARHDADTFTIPKVDRRGA